MTGLLRYADLDPEAYRTMSGVQLGAGVASGELSPVQLTRLALSLAEEADGAVNAYVGFRAEAALAEAAGLEREARDGRLRSGLHGVPIASKDNMYLAGEPCRKGSRTTDPTTVATSSSPFVQRLVDAGSVIIGRTTTPEFGWKGTGISPLTGVTRNPWDPTRNSGGSSAGSAVTVASGAVPIATGSDAGGSVRIPAAFCGTVGLKPTLSAIPVWPGTVNESLSHAGPLTRTVADARAVLDIVRGPDPRDPQSAFARADPATGRPLRVGVVRRPFGIAPSQEVEGRTAAALALVQGSGIARFEEFDLEMAVPREVFEGLWVTGRGHGFSDLIRDQGDVMDPGLARLLLLAQEYSLPDFFAVLQARRAFSAALFAVFDRVDLLLMPTMPLVAFEADREVPVGGEADAKLPWITWTPYTYPFNITGQPAVSVPFDLGEGRLPVGLQVVGGFSADDTVLALAQALERVLAPTNELTVAPRLRGN